MTEKTIRYTTPKQQIELLKSKGLLFDDEEQAEKYLEEYGYYNIINGYKTPYIENTRGVNKYIPGTTFEQIFSLFVLDHNLRNSIMAAMLDLEEYLRAATAEVIAHSFGTDHNNYLKWNNYRDRYVTNNKFSLRSILGTLQQNITSGKDPIKYYREKYGLVPPWILLKGTYFSTLINFIRLFKNKQKQELIRKIYSLNAEYCELECIKKLFSDTLFLCLEYRNCAAHGGRIYNFSAKNAKDIIENPELFEHFPDIEHLKDTQGISQLIILLSTFDYETPINILQGALHEEINRHLHLYPNDKEYIEKIIGFELTAHIPVWITANSNKFHFSPTCSGLKSPNKISYEELDLNTYQPCKRCYPK